MFGPQEKTQKENVTYAPPEKFSRGMCVFFGRMHHACVYSMIPPLHVRDLALCRVRAIDWKSPFNLRATPCYWKKFSVFAFTYIGKSIPLVGGSLERESTFSRTHTHTPPPLPLPRRFAVRAPYVFSGSVVEIGLEKVGRGNRAKT